MLDPKSITPDFLRDCGACYRIVAELISDYAYAYAVEADGHLVCRWSTDSLEQVTGYTEDDLQRRGGWKSLIVADDRRRFATWHDNLLAGRCEILDYRITTAKGERRWLRDNAYPVFDESEKRVTHLFGAVVNITECKKDEEALRQERDFAEALIETAQTVVLVLDKEGRVVRYNPYMEQLCGRPLKEVQGQGWIDTFLPEDHREACRRVLRDAVNQIPTSGHLSTILAKDGRRVLIEWRTTALVDTQGQANGVLAVGQDISEYKRAEEDLRMARDELEIRVEQRTLQLITANASLKKEIGERKRAEEELKKEQDLLRKSLELHERERQLVAYEIHDGFAQHLTGALLQLQVVEQLSENNPLEARRALGIGMQSLQESIREARRLMNGLRPPILDESGIVAAIHYLICESQQRGKPGVEFGQNVESRRYAPPLETAIFRIVQESLTNAQRYSESDTLRIDLVRSSDRLRLEVEDWGVGFDPDGVGESCFGLEGIRERARLLGGKAVIESASGKGTRITVDLPLVENAVTETA